MLCTWKRISILSAHSNPTDCCHVRVHGCSYVSMVLYNYSCSCIDWLCIWGFTWCLLQVQHLVSVDHARVPCVPLDSCDHHIIQRFAVS